MKWDGIFFVANNRSTKEQIGMFHPEVRHRAVVHYKYFFKSLRGVSKMYGVSKSTLHRWVRLDPTALEISRRRGSRKSAFTKAKQCIKETVRQRPFITMEQLAAVVAQECGMKRCRTTIGRYRAKCGLTRKKAFRVTHAERDPAQLQAFCNDHIRSASTLICIDEAGFYVGDHPRKGYMPKGQRRNVTASKTLRRSKFTLLLAAAPSGVVVHYKILDHNCRKADFVEFISELPVPRGAAH